MATYSSFLLLFVFLIGAIFAGFLMIKAKGTHRFVCKRKGKDHSSTKVYWMTEYHNPKDGVSIWKSWPFPDVKTLAPPSESVDFLPNGKKIASGYLISRDEVKWLKADYDEETKTAIEQGSKNSLTPAQRNIIVSQFEKSEEERAKKLGAAQLILQMGPIFIMGMVLIIGVIYAADIIKAESGRQKAAAERDRAMLEITQAQAKIFQAMGLENIKVSSTVQPTTTSTGVTVSPTEEPPTP